MLYAPMGRFQLELIDLFNTPKTCYNNERPTGQEQLLDRRAMENKGKLILNGSFYLFYISNAFLIL